MNKSQLAEICGLHAGDGYLRNDGRRIELDLSGNVEEDEFYENYVIPLFSNYFRINLIGKKFLSRNTYGFVIRNKHIVSFMHSLGFPYGKKTLSVKVPDFIFSSKDNKIRFLRGIFDTDGCITFEKKYKKFHYYPRIILSTCSKNLSDGLCRMLKELEVRFWIQTYKSKNPKENTRYKIWIRGKNEVEKWFRIIGSKNTSKLSRYLIWKKYGFCPPNLKYKQRKQILKNKLNPIVFYGSVAQSG